MHCIAVAMFTAVAGILPKVSKETFEGCWNHTFTGQMPFLMPNQQKTIII